MCYCLKCFVSFILCHPWSQIFTPRYPLSPPQRLLLVNTSERNGSGSAGERKRERWSFPFPAFPARFNFSSSQPPRAAGIFYPWRDCRRPLRRREEVSALNPSKDNRRTNCPWSKINPASRKAHRAGRVCLIIFPHELNQVNVMPALQPNSRITYALNPLSPSSDKIRFLLTSSLLVQTLKWWK